MGYHPGDTQGLGVRLLLGDLTRMDVRSAGSPPCLGQDHLSWKAGCRVDPGNWLLRGTLDYSAFGLFKLGAPGHGLSLQDAWAFASPSPCPLQTHIFDDLTQAILEFLLP